MKNGSAAAQIKLVQFDNDLTFPWITDEDERDEAEYRVFLRKVLPELLRVAKADAWLLSHAGAVDLRDIRAVAQRGEEGLELLWRTAPLAQRERLVESLREWWPRYVELRAETKRKADALIERRRAQ